MSNNSQPVTGLHGGKRVICAPSAIQKFNALKTLALQHHHWARIALGQLQGLATGRIGKDNIFITPNQNRRPGTHGVDEFFVILPGCTATIERKQNDEYHIIGLEVDARFGELQKQQTKPSMYFAIKHGKDQWECTLEPDGKLTTSTNTTPVVAISNSGYASAEDAAALTSPELKKYLGGGAGPFFESTGFNLHYTPGNKKLGGLKNFRDAISPLQNHKTLESAQLLAKAMYDARNTENIRWVSEFGGSAVLTQAMQMLSMQGVKLNKHTAFMIRPMTDINVAMKAALDLNLTLDRQFTQTNNLDYIGNRNQLAAISTRRKYDKNYTFGQAAWDRFCHLKTAQGVTAAGVTGAIGAASLAGIATVMPAALIPSAITPLLITVSKALGFTAGAIKTTDAFASAVAPKTYDKITGKFK